MRHHFQTNVICVSVLRTPLGSKEPEDTVRNRQPVFLVDSNKTAKTVSSDSERLPLCVRSYIKTLGLDKSQARGTDQKNCGLPEVFKQPH